MKIYYGFDLGGEDSDTFANMLPLARAMVDKYRDELGMSSFLVNLPSTDTSLTFVEDFRQYCKSEEWRMYIEKQVCMSNISRIYQNLRLRNNWETSMHVKYIKDLPKSKNLLKYLITEFQICEECHTAVTNSWYIHVDLQGFGWFGIFELAYM